MTDPKTDHRKALTNISANLREQVAALSALGMQSDHDLPDAMCRLLDAIDRIDTAAVANLDRRVPMLIAEPTPPALPVTIPPIVVPAISPGTYVRLRREALGLSLDDLALMLDTVPGVSARRRVEWLAMIESGAEEISLCVALALHDAIAIDLRVLAYWMAIAEGARPSLVEVKFASAPRLAS